MLFTDIVGSMRMNQTIGDTTAQFVVRARNDIGGPALDSFESPEVKHIGDGIKAAFKNTANAFATRIEIQVESTAHIAANPGHPLMLRIGMNAGEPIAEDGDLFGTTVQLAVHICDKAQAGQVLALGVARELCSGKLFCFKKASEYEMKGIADLISTFEVVPEAPDPDASEVDASALDAQELSFETRIAVAIKQATAA